jgi:hypothetical protein
MQEQEPEGAAKRIETAKSKQQERQQAQLSPWGGNVWRRGETERDDDDDDDAEVCGLQGD